MSTIDTLEAGRELDALVAEKVMGWKWYYLRDDNGRTVRVLVFEPFTTSWASAGWAITAPIADAEDWSEPPRYSTDIAAAWDVVAEVVNRTPGTIQFILSALFPNSGDATGWGAQFSTLFGSDCWSEEADTAPLAICLAALKAIDAGAGR